MSPLGIVSLYSILVCLLCAAAPVYAQDDGGDRILVAGFVPKVWPAVLCAVLYGLSGTLHWIHYFRTGRPRYMLTLTISMYAMVVGFVFRVIYSQGDNIYSVPWYALQALFILLAPCAFLATDYVILSRLSESLGDEIAKDCLFIRSSIIVKLFVWSDVITFFVQAAGSALTATDDMEHVGSIVAMVGLIFQIVSFAFFALLLFRFGWRARSHHPAIWNIGGGESGWRILGPFKVSPFYDWRVLWSFMCFTTILISMRCVFRIIEYEQGYRGYLILHEGYFYILDSLPLWVSMTLYAVLWPTRLQPVSSTEPSSMPYAMRPINDEGKAHIQSSRSVV